MVPQLLISHRFRLDITTNFLQKLIQRRRSMSDIELSLLRFLDTKMCLHILAKVSLLEGAVVDDFAVGLELEHREISG